MFEIRWRPSGGRGEYEYLASQHDVLGKTLIVQVPILVARIQTDVRCDFVDGKPRLRRKDPNDRSILNLPPLVAAAAGLPEPRREDKTGAFAYPLTRKDYVIDQITCNVLSVDDSEVVLEPWYLRPRHAQAAIDLRERITALVSVEGTIPLVGSLLSQLRAGTNASGIASLASEVHVLFPLGATAGASPEDTDEILAEYVGTEGKSKVRIHRYKERDPKLVKLAKDRFRKKHGKLFCQCCGIDFRVSYAPMKHDAIDAHHAVPLADVEEEKKTRVEDLMLLCPNCHRMVHRTSDCSVMAVKKILKANGSIVSATNLALLS